MIEKRVLVRERLREMPPRFGWVDHRLFSEGHLASLSHAAISLYLFLILVGDLQGLSFYSDRSIAKHLRLIESELEAARRELLSHRLIAWSRPLYQVLAIAPRQVQQSQSVVRQPRDTSPEQVGDLLRRILK